MGRPAREEYLADPCDVCGAKKGERCYNSKGKQIPPASSHKGRLQTWAVKNEMDAAPLPSMISVLDEKAVNEIATALNEGYDAMGREAHINMVLSAIAFSRKIGTTQDQIDRHLAEMIVDAEFDHELLEG
jgi:hypothetical protein